MQVAIQNKIDYALDKVYAFFVDLIEGRSQVKRDKTVGWKGPFTGN